MKIEINVEMSQSLLVNGRKWRIQPTSIIQLAGREVPWTNAIAARSRLSLKNKLLLIKSVILPILKYASDAWGYTGRTYILKLQRHENMSLRGAISNNVILDELSYKPMAANMKETAQDIFGKLETQPNPHLRELVCLE